MSLLSEEEYVTYSFINSIVLRTWEQYHRDWELENCTLY